MNILWVNFIGFCFSTSLFAHGLSAADKAKALTAGYWDYLELGATHMLTGYDHLLFLFGVIFFLTRFKDILIIITAFTLGHSITLIIATLLHIQANYFLIDAVIALTVMYKACENLDGFKRFFRIKAPPIVWMVFIFGLIHGFGLSTRFQLLPLSEVGLIPRILSFNVGVELGQIVALSIMLLILSRWRKTASFNTFSTSANILLLCVGFLLLLAQLQGYYSNRHSPHPPHSHTRHQTTQSMMDPVLSQEETSSTIHQHNQNHDSHQHQHGTHHHH